MTTNLDREIDSSLKELERRRNTKKALVVLGVVVVGGGLVALTTLMYNQTPAQIDEDRIGTEGLM